MPIDPRELAHHTIAGEIIDFDRPCIRCNYNLRGLTFGGRCPECGHPIHRKRSSTRFVDNLTDAPMNYLRTLRLGLIMMAVGSFAGLAAMGSLLIGALSAVGFAIAYAVLVGSSMIWWAGVHLSTSPRPRDNETIPDAILDSPALRLVARSIQAAWVVGAVSFAAAGYATGTGATVLAIVGVVLTFISMFGLVPLAVHLSALADWAGDSGLANRLRTAAWGIAVGGSAYALGEAAGAIGWAPVGLVRLAGMFLFWFAVLGYLVFVVSVLQMAHMAVWAIRNSVNAIETTRRIADRQARHEARIAERSYRAAEAAAHAKPAPVKEVVSRGPNVMPRPDGGAAPYPIE